MGRRLTASSDATTQLWARNLENGDIAVALYNKVNGCSPIHLAAAPIHLAAAISISLSQKRVI